MVVAALWTIACGASVGPVVHEHRVVERGAATQARVEIDMSAGELNVKSGAPSLFVGEFEYNMPGLKPAVAYAIDGAAGTLRLSQGFPSGTYDNTWRLNFNETTPLDLNLKLSAGDAQLVLGRLNLQRLEIRVGAGDLVVDLRGMPPKSYSVKVQAGAGDTTIHLPAGVGISARTTGPIGDVTVNGLEKRDGRWVNARADASSVIVDLEVLHAIGDLRLLAE